MNVYWIICVLLAAWFLFVHTPPVLIERDAIGSIRFMLHLFGVVAVYGGSLFNTLMTPSSLNGKARPYHIWVGRVALIGGVLCFCAGFSLSWFPLGVLPVWFAAFITSVGCIQLYAEFVGFRSIQRFQRLRQQIEEMESSQGVAIDTEDMKRLTEDKNAALQSHIFHMVMLLVIGCGFPALLRLAYYFGSFRIALGVLVLYTTNSFMVKKFAKTYIPLSPQSQPPQKYPNEATKLTDNNVSLQNLEDQKVSP